MLENSKDSEGLAFYNGAMAEGLARGLVKIDGGPAINADGITGDEIITKGRPLYAEEALAIHDRMVTKGALKPNEPVREHIERLIKEVV